MRTRRIARRIKNSSSPESFGLIPTKSTCPRSRLTKSGPFARLKSTHWGSERERFSRLKSEKVLLVPPAKTSIASLTVRFLNTPSSIGAKKNFSQPNWSSSKSESKFIKDYNRNLLASYRVIHVLKGGQHMVRMTELGNIKGQNRHFHGNVYALDDSFESKRFTGSRRTKDCDRKRPFYHC